MLFAFGLKQVLEDPEVFRRVATATILFFTTTVLSFVVGYLLARWKAGAEWGKKQFLGRIIVSLNTFADGWLKIRTVFEKSLEEVFLNSVAINKVRKAAQRTTKADPLLPIEAKDRWFLLNFVLNAVAERFCDAQVRYDAGQPLRPVPYLIFLTCEVVGEDRIRKVRAMMIRKDLLQEFPYLDTMPRLEQEWHADRIVTLRRAAELYRKEPDNFLTLEVYV